MDKRGDRIIPTAAASATPSGLATKEAYETVTGIIIDGVRRHEDSDGILLALHGAWGNLGPSAILNIDGILVIVASERIQARDPEIFRVCGIEPNDMNILVVK